MFKITRFSSTSSSYILDIQCKQLPKYSCYELKYEGYEEIVPELKKNEWLPVIDHVNDLVYFRGAIYKKNNRIILYGVFYDPTVRGGCTGYMDINIGIVRKYASECLGDHFQKF